MPSSTFSNILDFQRSATVANSIQSGIRHLLEFALNGNPTNPSINGYIASLVQDSTAPAGNEMTLIVAVRDGATFVSGANGVRSASVDGVTYTVEDSLEPRRQRLGIPHLQARRLGGSPEKASCASR